MTSSVMVITLFPERAARLRITIASGDAYVCAAARIALHDGVLDHAAVRQLVDPFAAA